MDWKAKGVLLVHVLRHASTMTTDTNLLHKDFGWDLGLHISGQSGAVKSLIAGTSLHNNIGKKSPPKNHHDSRQGLVNKSRCTCVHA